MDRLQELDEKVLMLRSLSRVAQKKIVDAKENDAHVNSQTEFLQLQLTALRQRTLVRTLLQLQRQLTSQRQRLSVIAHKTVDCCRR